MLGHRHSRFVLCSDQAVQSNKLVTKKESHSGPGEENSSSRMTRPRAGLVGVREESPEARIWQEESKTDETSGKLGI